MTLMNYKSMELDELRRYMLRHREDIDAFQTYVDRSKAEERMINIDSEDPQWQREIDKKMPPYHHPDEQNYLNEEVEIETSTGQNLLIITSLLRIYPENFNNYDAYMDIPMANNSDIRKVRSPRFGKKWEVITGPTESLIRGYFRGDYTENNPPVWVYGLRLVD